MTSLYQSSSSKHQSDSLLSSGISAIKQNTSAIASPKTIKVKVLVLRGGGGHYATYQSLKAAFVEQHPHWELETIFVDALGEYSENAGAEKVSTVLGQSSDRFYDFLLKNGLGWVHLITIHIHKLLTRLRHQLDVELLAERWQADPPDLVLSVVPFHNRALHESLQLANANAPVVTILTDFADSPPAYWMAPGTDNYVVCGTEKAIAQALQSNIASERVIPTSGLVINPRFYSTSVQNVDDERWQLGLDPERMTGLVLFGANGANVMLEIAKQLEPLGDSLQLIFICGRNQSVADALRDYKGVQKRAVIGFTSEIPFYMHLADFFIGKPGNVSVSEAIAMNLPLIVERNWLTLPQERYAADWIKEQQVGITIQHFRHVRSAVEQLIEPAAFAQYQQRVSAIENRAVFEIPERLEEILLKQERIAH